MLYSSRQGRRKRDTGESLRLLQLQKPQLQEMILSYQETKKLIELVNKELGYLQDNQYRYKMALGDNQDLQTGNGESFRKIIDEHQQDINFLKSIRYKLENE